MRKATITNDISLAPYTVIRCGETGTVVNDDEYGIDIRMDKHHDGLRMWANVAHICTAELEGVVIRRGRSVTLSYAMLCVLVGLALLGCFEAVEDVLQMHTGLHKL